MNKVLLSLAALAAVIFVLIPSPPEDVLLADPPGFPDRLQSKTLAGWVITGDRHFHLVDVRPTERFLENGLCTAVSMPADSLDLDVIRSIPSGHMVVLYGENDDDVIDTFRRVKAIHDQTYVVAGGHEACQREILTIPDPPTENTEEAWDEYRTRVALARYLTGESDEAPAPAQRVVRPMVRPRIKVANEGC